MKSRFIALTALAVACILAAGGGAYLAVRQSQQASHPAQALGQPAASVQQPTARETPVAVVTPPPAPTDTTATASPSPAPAPVRESNAGPGGVSRESAKPSRRTRRERLAPPLEGDASQAAVNQPDMVSPRPYAPSGGTESTGQQAGAPPPQSIAQAPPEPQREWVDVTVPSETVLGLQIQNAVSSESAHVEDRVEARVTRDVRVGDRVAIPAGSQALGSVVQVERGGKVKDRAHFAIRFNTILLPDGSRLALTAEAVHREGPSPANKSAARIGGATVGGAILGAILGGGKGAAIGGAIGAGGGTAATMASEREPATLPAGSIVNIRLMSPVTVTLER
jgi:hypothetical protein